MRRSIVINLWDMNNAIVECVVYSHHERRKGAVAKCVPYLGACFFVATTSGRPPDQAHKGADMALILFVTACNRTSVLVAKERVFSLKRQGFAENKCKITIAI